MVRAGARLQAFATVLRDIAAFFDSVPLPALVSAAADMDFPGELLAPSLCQHLAPHFSFDPGHQHDRFARRLRSSLGGVEQRRSFTAVLALVFLRPILACRSTHTWTTKMVGPHAEVEARLLPPAIELGRSLQRLGLRISDTITVVATTPALASRVPAQLRERGLLAKAAEVCRDSGLDHGVGPRRCCPTHRLRLGKGLRRLWRIARMATGARQASKLVLTGGHAQAIRGTTALGMSWRQRERVRATFEDAGHCTGGRSATCVLGPHSWFAQGPQVTGPVGMVGGFLRFWANSSPELKLEVRQAWPAGVRTQSFRSLGPRHWPDWGGCHHMAGVGVAVGSPRLRREPRQPTLTVPRWRRGPRFPRESRQAFDRPSVRTPRFVGRSLLGPQTVGLLAGGPAAPRRRRPLGGDFVRLSSQRMQAGRLARGPVAQRRTTSTAIGSAPPAATMTITRSTAPSIGPPKP